MSKCPEDRGEALAAMKATALFSAVDESTLRGFLDRCLTRKVRRGTVLFTSADPADRFFLVLEGRVKIFKLSPRGAEQILHLYGPGETFGEAALWAGGPFPAHAEAVAPSTLLVIPRQALRRAIARNADLAMGMMAGLSAKLRDFNRLIEDLSLKEVPARLARVLLEEFDRTGETTFRLRQTKRQLAAQIGTVAETLSRAFARLKAAGVINVRGAKITILDADALAKAAETE